VHRDSIGHHQHRRTARCRRFEFTLDRQRHAGDHDQPIPPRHQRYATRGQLIEREIGIIELRQLDRHAAINRPALERFAIDLFELPVEHAAKSPEYPAAAIGCAANDINPGHTMTQPFDICQYG
jgi:hypothetical protein